MRKILFLLALLGSTAASASGYADIWWNPNESGWGVTVSQQYANMFLTFFVYDSNNQPHWYVAGMLPGATQPNGLDVWSGQMVSTNGPYFGGPFNPSQVTGSAVGTVTFTPASAYSATLTYSVNGVTVTKSIVRETIGAIPLAGNYYGAYSVGAANCDAALVGAVGTVAMAIATQPTSGTNGTIQTAINFDNQDLCGLSGNYSQQGSIFGVSNAAGCISNLGIVGATANFSSLEWTGRGMDTDFTIAAQNGCYLKLTIGTVRAQ